MSSVSMSYCVCLCSFDPVLVCQFSDEQDIMAFGLDKYMPRVGHIDHRYMHKSCACI
jgi:hypothetical protein